MTTSSKPSEGGHQLAIRPTFVPYDDVFIETPFARRFSRVLRDAQKNRSSHVVSATPGSGKTWCIRDMVVSEHPTKFPNGTTRLPVMTTCAPSSDSRAPALGFALALCFGTIPTMPWSRMFVWLTEQIVRAQVELIIIDDAHELSIVHLKLLKELVGRLALPPYDHRVGLCFVAASYGAEHALVQNLSRPEMLWEQFRRRLDAQRPFCLILGHTEAEVRDILGAFETHYHAQLPHLHLVRWSKSIYTYLTHPTLDPSGSKRVTMDNLTKLVTAVVRKTYEEGLSDITSETLYEAAQWLTLGSRHDVVIDDETPGDAHESAR